MTLTNQLKTILPWSCVVALVAGMLILRSRGKETETQLATLRQANDELKKTRLDEEDVKRIQAQVEELGRLRKENEELHRLRNEIRQLREEKQGAARAGQPGQPPSAQPRADGSAPPQLQRQLQQLMAENERLRAENQQLQQIQVNVSVNACINNLRTIAGAKDQWALENKKGTGDA